MLMTWWLPALVAGYQRGAEMWQHCQVCAPEGAQRCQIQRWDEWTPPASSETFAADSICAHHMIMDQAEGMVAPLSLIFKHCYAQNTSYLLLNEDAQKQVALPFALLQSIWFHLAGRSYQSSVLFIWTPHFMETHNSFSPVGGRYVPCVLSHWDSFLITVLHLPSNYNNVIDPMIHVP